MQYDIPNIPAAVLAVKEKKIKRFPCHANRASGLGYAVPFLGGCLRRGVYERTHWEVKQLHDVRVQSIFDEGNNQEKQVLRDLDEAGINIIEQQTAYVWDRYQITGHIDGKLVVKQAGDGATSVAIPIEIKSMAPHIFDSVNCWQDFTKKPWTRAYMVQITLYMLMQGIDVGVFILKNKSTGALKQINVDLDYDLGEQVLQSAEQINKHVAVGSLPDKITDIDKCADCPFSLTCQPDVKFGTELKIEDDPAFEEKVDRYLDMKADAIECEHIYNDMIKPKLKASAVGGNLNMVVGKYHITGKTDSRGAFRPDISLA